ncbi:sensor domain-containing diguanylate cyclase [Kurthia huakuii]|uniref:sensor domain-containing diguanylate cyclase n=1 Tax=Kurthia huakuii TaxID=1421019 RepID=UPI0004972382|nr:sensor domain-containing diguanylate cyclase [Kurthia huakuii]MBM7699895.1 diguanylate cyclase (GGDEF)-like protein/PAS domain S-box-containing protein [Kurthia huakuii]
MDIRLRKAPCGFLSTNDEGKIVEVNETFLRWISYTEQQLLGQHVEMLLSPTNKLMFHSYFYPTIQLKNIVEEFFLSMRDSNKKSVPFLMNAKRYMRDGEEVIDYILMKMQHRLEYEREVQSLKIQAEEAYEKKSQAFDHLEQIYAEIEQKQNELMAINLGLIELSNTDKLTGLYNRRYFSQKMSEFIRAFDMEHVQFSLLIIDIDHFKNVNDTYGHQVGDIVLEQLAQLLKEVVGEQGVVCRFGGEEFTIILIGHSQQVADDINKRAAAKEWPHIHKLTVSVGMANFTEHDDEQSLIQRADEALYYSKEHGRNRVTIYEEMH